MRVITNPLLSVGVAILVGLIPLSLQGADKASSTKAQPLPKVDVYKVGSAQPAAVTFAYPARLNALANATVTSRITGVLIQKLYKEGSFVKKGELLYRIEPDTYAALVNERSADVEVKKAALTNAQRDWERVENLYKNNAISKKEYDAALSAYEMAKADVSSAAARLQSAKIDLNYTAVKAPISGIVEMKQIDVGNVVTAGTPLVSITQVDPIYAEFSVPDVDLQKAGSSLQSLSKSGKLPVAFNYNGTIYSGVVDYVAPQINTSTGSVKVRARLKNPNNVLIPGAFGRINIVGVHAAAVITVPQKAVLQNKMGTIVMVVDKGVVGIRPIKLGKKSGDDFIIEQGLKAGDTVIVNNFFRIQPGAPVAIDKVVNSEGK
ncbi:efflux RND transporter periplasmic adaptor subunit [Sulfuricurvum sp.]|uniref:efflux RND transporter periplasmic adaptor subunit n=1 Tax=Sulfuricurvum sp. TaxID=2025608 RepID=UPI00261CFE2D|nr:efflux RND transporter periplasmic adaptor subunit [Sulfuricurvum sp.]MDD3598194.1 efflux RND transporter periplasmic adaptor subunit [Sulfuricurvum sp.]